jgi:hypothetical protein
MFDTPKIKSSAVAALIAVAELFTRASFLIGLLIGQDHEQGD